MSEVLPSSLPIPTIHSEVPLGGKSLKILYHKEASLTDKWIMVLQSAFCAAVPTANTALPGASAVIHSLNAPEAVVRLTAAAYFLVAIAIEN
jgi:hypothetical protein